ncbi:hypothetical protein [Streptomyces marispadix]|uniref:Transposase n=1 Tax=Streptomyces marispadix TaxID=2922868 RepID=A0ABS9T0J8_9ACTN|nr:hypothetical protein [Streptomyces marispadix]MCH6162022.1 hypothetical protein [Streptomyces marispadix]
MAIRTRYRTAGGGELVLVRPLLLGHPRWRCTGCRIRRQVSAYQAPEDVANQHAHDCRAIPRT